MQRIEISRELAYLVEAAVRPSDHQPFSVGNAPFDPQKYLTLAKWHQIRPLAFEHAAEKSLDLPATVLRSLREFTLGQAVTNMAFLGICVRLYSEEDYQARDRFTSPEIQRANLSAVILQTKTLELGDIEHFPLLDPPRPDAVRDGYKTLFEIGALDEHHGLTEFGRQLSRLPIDPRLARVVWAGHVENCLHEVLIITAGLSVQDPRERPTDRQQAADELHARYSVAESDFLGYLKLWDFVHGLRQELSRTQFRKTCRDQFLSFNRLREWFDVHRQLLELTQQAGLRPNHRRDDSKAIHRALLPGFLSNVAQRTEARDYLVAGGHKAQLWPGSSTQSTRPQWVVATEQVELTRRYLRTVGHINPKWIESLAPHLVNRSYSEAHWHRGTGSPMVFEKVTLMGLVLVPRRQVPYGPLDALRARAIFIQHALVEGDFRTWGKFLAHNQELIAEMERLEAKTRRRDLLHEARARYEFYHRKLPADVYDAHRFEAWRRKVEQQSPRFLFMTPADLLRVPIDSIPQQEFPESLSVEDLQLPLAYEFDPDSHSDGITLLVPREGMNKLDRRQLGWLVPGLVEEKVVALIRALPKDVRRAFVPVPDTAQRVMVTLEYGVGDFYAVVARALSEIGREPIRPEWFDETLLPPHLRMNIRVVDAEGKSLAAGRDLGVLRTQLAVEAEAAAPVEPLTAPWLQEKLTSWTIGDLPQQVDYSRAGVKLRAYPALVDRGESAAVQLFDTPEKAAHEHRAGLRRLFQLAAHRELRGQIAWLPHMETMTLEAASLPDHRHLQRRIEDLLTDLAFCSSDLPRSRSEFEERLSQGRDALPAAVQDVAGLLPELFSQFHRVRLALESAVAAHLQPAVADMQSQLDALMRSGFLTSTPWPWLVHYPRYLRGMLTRLDRLRSGGMERDRQAMELVGRRWRDFEERRESHESRQVFDAELERFRWLLEEYRVSLFAQGLGTSQPVSEKRLDRQWARVKS